jgi:hypothetical protein
MKYQFDQYLETASCIFNIDKKQKQHHWSIIQQVAQAQVLILMSKQNILKCHEPWEESYRSLQHYKKN